MIGPDTPGSGRIAFSYRVYCPRVYSNMYGGFDIYISVRVYRATTIVLCLYSRLRNRAYAEGTHSFMQRKILGCISFDVVCTLVMQIPRYFTLRRGLAWQSMDFQR